MRAVVQRVSRSSVTIDRTVVGSTGPGLVVLVGVEDGDEVRDADVLADKVIGLRIFGDPDGRMNRSVAEVGGSVLAISQFTLVADVRRGRRPSFTTAADPTVAEPLVKRVVERMRTSGVPVETGVFGANMSVSLDNDGPVTIVVDTVGGSIV
ncbi:MAG: D-tyrosyl-tRNA(Tyr) deacylase [Acidimicrobiia bacterium]|nr:D-tyrosyl-tRNA(Tyr) deacylase [Acidimicrobiia bacterium]